MKNIINDNMDASAEPVMAERVVASVNDKSSASVESSKKGINGMLVGLIFCILVSLGAIGFGAWAIIDAYQQISDLKSQVNTLEEQLSDATDIDTTDYIYVGEWGIKFKIPDSLNNIQYKFVRSDAGGFKFSTESLCVSGVYNATGLYGFNNLDDGAYVCISQNFGAGAGVYNEALQMTPAPEGEFYIQGPQAAYSADEEEIKVEQESVQAIRDWLSDDNVRSEI